MKHGYEFTKPELFGDEQDPAIQETKRRIELTGRPVVILPRPTHDTGLGICGLHICNCKEPCKSIHYKAKAQ